MKVGRTFSYPNMRRPDSGSKTLSELKFQVNALFIWNHQPQPTFSEFGVHLFLPLQIGDYLDVAILFQWSVMASLSGLKLCKTCITLCSSYLYISVIFLLIWAPMFIFAVRLPPECSMTRSIMLRSYAIDLTGLFFEPTPLLHCCQHFYDSLWFHFLFFSSILWPASISWAHVPAF